MIWAAVSSWSCFCWLYRASPSLAAKKTINLILVLTIRWCPCVESFPMSQLFAWGGQGPYNLSVIEPIFAWNVPLVSLILLKRSLVFPIPLFSSISLHSSLKNAFLSLLAIHWNSPFRWIYLSFSPLPFASLLFSAICKASSDNHFVFLFIGDGFDHGLLYNVTNLHP